MSDSRIFRIARVPPGFLEHFDHQPAALNGHRRVVRTVKGPYGYVSDLICVTRIPTTANRDRGSELCRVSYESFSGREAPHGNSGYVGAVEEENERIFCA